VIRSRKIKYTKVLKLKINTVACGYMRKPRPGAPIDVSQTSWFACFINILEELVT